MRVRDKSKVVDFNRSRRIESQEPGPGQMTYDEALAWRPQWAGSTMSKDPVPFNQVDIMVDHVVKDFHKLIAEGKYVPTNPCTKEVVKHAATEVYLEMRWIAPAGRYFTPWWQRRYYAFIDSPPPLMSEPNFAPLVTEARAKMQGGFMDVLTSASEFHKTVEMVIGFKKRVREAIQGCIREANRRGKFRGVKTLKKAMEVISSFWLEYRFGWRILWYEYNSIVDVINSLDREIVRRSFRVRKPQDDIVQEPWTQFRSIERRAAVGKSSTFSAGATGTVSGNGRVLLDPITTAWELLPLSFVIDYFWNVGDVLLSMSPFGVAEEDEAWISSRRETYLTYEYRPIIPDGLELMRWDVIRDGNIAERELYKRELWEGRFDFPRPDINLSVAKALDLGALTVILSNSLLDVIKRNRV